MVYICRLKYIKKNVWFLSCYKIDELDLKTFLN
jgi:hypothetical protein